MSTAAGTPSSAIAIPMAAPARSSGRETLARLLRTPTFLIAAFVIGFWTFCAFFGYHIAPHDPTFQTADILQSPNGKYPFGTDQIGQDVLSRVIAGSRSTMEIAPAATLIATTAGTAIGLMLGYFRGWFDEIVGRLIDAFLAIPGIIFLIAVITSLGSSVRTLIITIGVAFTPIIARTVRAAVLAEAGQDYVQAAKLRGEKAPYILFVEILPNIVPPIIVEATVRLGYAIFTVVGITFLGLGLQPPTPDWSVDITAGFQNLNDTFHDGYYWQVLFPGLAIISICVAVAMLADSLQQVFDR
ncbi:MAG: peptide/nickel transport system permease protein [Gaiellales bacterium]|jgi:peptide/nickel transport system permease protein|nr:peptide/nickel transport system permease protein [Gaiellales bacterium]